MDEDTQKLIERTRQRREMLNQRFAGMPEAAPRKRRTPVLEQDGSEKVLSEKSINQDDSPKRQCLRSEELQMKADTPAIQSVESRRKVLTDSVGESDEENTRSNPVPTPRKSISSPPLERKNQSTPEKSPLKATAPPSSRKNRFAALAQHINNWEDDLTHHNIHAKEEEKKPKWQPPKATNSPSKMDTSQPPVTKASDRASRGVVSSTKQLSKSTSPAKVARMTTSPVKEAKGSATPVKAIVSQSPQKTPANLPTSAATPANNLARNSPLRSSKVATPALSASTPASVISKPVPSSSTVASTKKPAPNDPSDLPVSQRISQMKETLANITPRARTKDEPTAYSVGARMSAWENMTSSNLVSSVKKVNPGEATPTTKPKITVPSFTPKIPKVAATPSGAAPPNPPPPPEVKTSVTPAKSFRDCIEEKASAVWSKKGVDIKASPTKASPSKSAPALNKSPTKFHSPSKVSTGTKVVQQLLVGRSQEISTNSSTLAAQSRAARMAELDAIQNRWKNGVLKDDTASSSDEGKSEEAQPVSKTPGKKEEARNKARADFNNKLAEIGLGDGEAKATNTPARPPPPKTGSSVKATPGGTTGSIYSLIKKREETPQKNKANDSFDDSDDEQQKVPRTAALRAAKQASQEKEGEAFKKPAVPENKDRDSDVISTSDAASEDFGSSDKLPMEIDDDDISLRGFVSEAVRRESMLPPPTLRRDTSQSSLDSYEDERQADINERPSTSKQAGYQPDNESMDDDDDENDRNAVDDLLDEALDDTDDYDPDMDPRNVVLRKKKPVVEESSDDYDPDMDVNNVVMRRKPQGASAYPVPAQRSKTSYETTDDDEEDDRPYSLQAYRKSAHVLQHTMEPVIRVSKYVGKPVHEEDLYRSPQSKPQKDDKRVIQERIKELQELVQQEQNVIMQTSNALNKCCVGNTYFAGSAEQVECNRILLLACQKRQNYMTEIQRLKETGILNEEGAGPKGSLTISDIRLPLKKEFVTKIGTSHDNMTHFFILLIRNGCQLICTQMLSTHDPMMRGSLDFPNLIKINGITGNFKLTLDIYSMSISREAAGKDKKKKTPKKQKGFPMHLESPGGPMAVRTTSFSQVTSLQLTMKSLDKNSFHLERLPYLSPLYGQIFMRLKCMMESNVEERGFLTMFDDVSGFGAWHRRWCVLSGNKLCVWKYPDDENRKDPMAMIDLKRCVTEKVGLVPRDICARPNTFELVTVRQPLKGEHDTLITKTYNTMTTVRHQMSADSKEERIVWCNKLNKTLSNLRTWNADALRPNKQR